MHRLSALAALVLVHALAAGEPAAAPTSPVPPASPPTAPAAADYRPAGYFPGVNLAAAEFGKGTELNRDYTYPKAAEFAYFQGKGMRVVRIPFRWARVQPQLRGELDPANIAELDRCIEQAGRLGLAVLLDLHNYGGRSVDGASCQIGLDDALTSDDFNDFWVRMAGRYKDKPLVWFGLMNEPHKQPAELTARIMQSALNAIRAAGARNFVTVPGTAWSGAHSWVKSGNAAAYDSFTDPADNFAFEVHQYLDKTSAGISPKATTGAGAKRLLAFTAWAKEHRFRAFLGEFGWDQNPRNAQAQAEGEALLACMDQAREVWVGYTYWAAGPWWPKSYMYLLEPADLAGEPIDKPQMAIIAQHLK